MKPRFIVPGILFAVAILTFVGLAYQTVPMSTIQTITQESTETGASYSPYPFVTNTITYTSTSIEGMPVSTGSILYCWHTPPVPCYTFPMAVVVSWNSTTLQTVQSAYEIQSTDTIPYSQTMTSSITESSTNIVPAYSSLGLTDTGFVALSIVVIGVLDFITAWIVLKSKPSHRPKQATTSQFMKPSDSCVKCGADLPPASKFCNNCGTKQP